MLLLLYLTMTPLIVLYFIPIGLIAIVIIAIIRLIIRAASKDSNSQTYKPPYTPPPQNPGQYGQPNQPNTQYPPSPHSQVPPVWQNPGAYQQPDYTQQPPNTPPDYTQQTYTPPAYNQPNYQQPNYTQPNYTQPDYTQTGNYQAPGSTKRSTNIPGGYATHVPGPPPKSNAGLIAGIIIGVIVLVVGGAVALFVAKNNATGLTTSSFHLAYDNPTESTYFIILDDWDTIKVAPHTSSDNLDYTFSDDLQNFHWQMTTEDGTVIADTTLSRADVEAWHNDRTLYNYGNSLIVFNPSRSEFVYYTAWTGDEGSDYMDDIKVGDSTYFADAYITTEAFIFDQRDPDYLKALGEPGAYDSYEQTQFLVSAADFPALFSRMSGTNRPNDIFNNYRNQLLDLFTYAREEVMSNNAYDSDDVITLYDLDSVTPGPIDEYTEARDFVPAIDFVKANSRLFKATAPDQYNYIIDSADVVLKHAYVEQPRNENSYPEMKVVTYLVYHDGFFNDEPRREISYEYDRDPESGGNEY